MRLRSVDVAIVGAGVAGAATAWWLRHLDPSVSVALIERDPQFSQASSQRSASSIRQQFSIPVNVALSQFGLRFLQQAQVWLTVDGQAPALGLTLPGYLYLADADQAPALRQQNVLQRQLGADIRLLDAAGLAERFPWLHTQDLALGAHGEGVEGWFDGPALHLAFVRAARALGVHWMPQAVTQLVIQGAPGPAGPDGPIPAAGRRLTGLRLADGSLLHCRHLVNAAGPWSRALAQQAGLHLPVHARRRTVFVLSCPTALPECPLVIDPSGFWFRPDGPAHPGGQHVLFGTTPEQDEDDLPLEPQLQEFSEDLWAQLAHRVPAFEAVRVERAWAGYYEMNTFDHNALIGPHADCPGLLSITGFSGHGMQQAAGAGRGLAEWILYGQYRSLDLTPLSPDRVARGEPLREANVIG
jgi:FAD-dependent oxidoreductase domain-containing protein 1